MKNATKFLNAALSRVESASIKEWAQSEHNLPVWTKIAEGEVKRGKSASKVDDVAWFAGYIVGSAMGL
jgi:hypothetical protein